jgi:hypothetical protein
MSKRLVLSLLPAAALSLAALAIFLTSCGTMRNVNLNDPKSNRVFGGVRYDVEDSVECVAGPPAAKVPEAAPAGRKTRETDEAAANAEAVSAIEHRPFRWIELSFDVIDVPFSVAGDILTLPWVVYARVEEYVDRHKQSDPVLVPPRSLPASSDKP